MTETFGIRVLSTGGTCNDERLSRRPNVGYYRVIANRML